MLLVAVYQHLFLFISYLSPSHVAAILLALAFELVLWFSSLSSMWLRYKRRYSEADSADLIARWFITIVLIGNLVVMLHHFKGLDLGFNKSVILSRLVLPILVSIFIPFASYSLGKISGYLWGAREEADKGSLKSIEKIVKENIKRNPRYIKKLIYDNTGFEISTKNIREIQKKLSK